MEQTVNSEDVFERVRRAAVQQLRTCLLSGVDFVPLGPPAEWLAASAPTEVSGRPLTPGRLAPPHTRIEPGHALGRDEQESLLATLESEHAEACAVCTSITGYTRPVFGEGDPNADLMFVGEAPGQKEDELGRPFVGRAGQKLTEIIRAMGLAREQVYITNIVKVRPPNNRTPTPDEVDQWGPYLDEQIKVIRPRVIVTLGGPSTKYLLGTGTGITRLRGTWAEYDAEGFVVPVMPTFHPAFLLRNYTPDTRRQVWSDMQLVMEKLGLKS